MDDFFRFSKKFGFWVFLVHPTVVSVLLSAWVERRFVSSMRNFFLLNACPEALLITMLVLRLKHKIQTDNVIKCYYGGCNTGYNTVVTQAVSRASQ